MAPRNRANSMKSSSHSDEIIETKPQLPNSKDAIVEAPSIGRKEDASQQQLKHHSQDEGPTKDTMADADHINANGSKIESKLNSCDKDYNEEKEFQRASKVHSTLDKLLSL